MNSCALGKFNAPKKETLRRNGGCKPKPTAYEKTFMKELILLLFQ